MSLMEAYVASTEEAKDLWVPRTIRQITEITPIEFYREYVGRNVPLLIRGGCKHWKAMDWTDEYLKTAVTNPVTVAITPDGRGDCIKDDTFILPFETTMPLTEFFDQLRRKDRVHYIQKQCSSLDLEFDALLGDVPVLDWASEAFGQDPDATNIWIGDERAVSSTHKDPYENIYCVVAGTKEFTLLPPTDAPYLYRKPYPIGKYTESFDIEKQEGTVPWIPVDPDDPDLTKYPLFAHASPIVVQVEKGDVLYLPSLWFHKVKQVPEDGRCIAVNYWYDMRFDARYTWSVFQDHTSGLFHQ